VFSLGSIDRVAVASGSNIDVLRVHKVWHDACFRLSKAVCSFFCLGFCLPIGKIMKKAAPVMNNIHIDL